MPPIPHRIRVRRHPGSSRSDVDNEPDWAAGHLNRIGFRNRQGRLSGLTHAGDERVNGTEIRQRALKEGEELKSRIKKGDLVNFRDVIENQEVCIHFVYCWSKLYKKSNKGRISLGLPLAPAQRPFGRLAIRS